MPCPSHPPRLYYSNCNWWRVQITKVLVMQVCSTLLSPHPSLVQISFSAPCSETPSVCVPPFTPIQTPQAKCSFLHPPVTSSHLGSNIFLSTLFSNTLSLCSSLHIHTDPTGKLIVLYILIYKFFDNRQEVKGYGPNSSKHYQKSISS
jgi:hypothetical protein